MFFVKRRSRIEPSNILTSCAISETQPIHHLSWVSKQLVEQCTFQIEMVYSNFTPSFPDLWLLVLFELKFYKFISTEQHSHCWFNHSHFLCHQWNTTLSPLALSAQTISGAMHFTGRWCLQYLPYQKPIKIIYHRNLQYRPTTTFRTTVSLYSTCSSVSGSSSLSALLGAAWKEGRTLSISHTISLCLTGEMVCIM